jgi:hypothetical protein
VLPQQFLKARFMKRALLLFQQFDFGVVAVSAYHMAAKFCQP